MKLLYPPAYDVYKGYICLSFSVTAESVRPRILKFVTNIGYDLLYCVSENQSPHTYHFIYLFIFFFAEMKVIVTYFLASMKAKVFELCALLERVKIFCLKRTIAGIYSVFSIYNSSIFHLSLHCNA